MRRMLSPEIEDLKPLSMIFVLHWEIMVALASVGPGGPEYVCHELRSTVYMYMPSRVHAHLYLEDLLPEIAS